VKRYSCQKELDDANRAIEYYNGKLNELTEAWKESITAQTQYPIAVKSKEIRDLLKTINLRISLTQRKGFACK
jgi:hypothetical protein